MTLFTSRRHFLVRAAGAVAASTIVAMPVAAASPRERIERLKIELAAALVDEFGDGFEVVVTDNEQTPANCIAPGGLPRTIMLRANAA